MDLITPSQLASATDAWHDSRATGVHVKLTLCPDCQGAGEQGDDECERCEGSGEVVKGATDECE